MVPKGSNGQFAWTFRDNEWGNGFTEGNSWHHSFPPYVVNGLAELYGGKKNMLAKLHALLQVSADFGVGSYHQEIHEMTEVSG